MLKSPMDLFDVFFPLNIGPLTYRRPSHYNGPILPGMLVKTEIRKGIRFGVILEKAIRPPSGPIKEIREIVLDKPVISGSLLRLLKWMAGYYLVPEGVVLKSVPLLEYFEYPTRGRKQKAEKKDSPQPDNLNLPESSPEIVSPIRESIFRKEYKTFLLHAPSLPHEISYLLNIIKDIGNVIILVPEVSHIELLSPILRKVCGDRLAVLHGRLTKTQRKQVIGRILSGASDVILGTRIAVSAPLPSVSLIFVLQEQNRFYKNLEGVHYHARDVAVMRGYLQNAVVVLSSACPSLESFYNTVKGKYKYLKPDEKFQRSRIEVINMRTAKKIAPYLSRRAVEAAASCVKNKEGALFFINRKGYSMIQCADCNNIETCPDCNIPLIFHKAGKPASPQAGKLKCHYCGYSSHAPATCPMCRGSRLETVGAGTQRIAADIRKHLSIEPLRFDRDSVREDPGMKGLADVLHGDEVVVGTKIVAGRLRRETYRLCVFLNPDSGLHLPDFRSPEFLFQEIIGLSECIKPGGLVIIQTKMPENHVFKFIRNYNFEDFFKEELAVRKSLSYPPYSRMILISISSADAGKKTAVMDALTQPEQGIEVIGPAEISQKGKHIWKILVKSPSRERLFLYTRSFLEKVEKEKALRVTADVDPISI